MLALTIITGELAEQVLWPPPGMKALVQAQSKYSDNPVVPL